MFSEAAPFIGLSQEFQWQIKDEIYLIFLSVCESDMKINSNNLVISR